MRQIRKRQEESGIQSTPVSSGSSNEDKASEATLPSVEEAYTDGCGGAAAAAAADNEWLSILKPCEEAIE